MISRAQTTEAQPQHHVDEDVLLAYAAGSLPEAASLVAAAHLTLCPHCRAVLRVVRLMLSVARERAFADLANDRS